MGGLIVGTSPGLQFRSNCPYTGCRICGAIFQSDLDRTPNKDIEALELRRAWSLKHALTHPQHEHDKLEKSGRWCTPEASQVLASFGVIAVTDMVLSEEHEQALLESKSVPVNDVEGA